MNIESKSGIETNLIYLHIIFTWTFGQKTFKGPVTVLHVTVLIPVSLSHFVYFST